MRKDVWSQEGYEMQTYLLEKFAEEPLQQIALKTSMHLFAPFCVKRPSFQIGFKTSMHLFAFVVKGIFSNASDVSKCPK